MLILAIDSASSACSACVWQDGKILSEMTEPMERGQDQRLMPLILEVMKKAGTEFDRLDRIAVTRGPGSFTGLRIGLAAARGIGLAANKPVTGIDRFSIFYEQEKASGKNLLVIIESRRRELFCKFYPVSGTPHDATMLDEEQIAAFLKTHPDTVIAGDRQGSREKEVLTCARLASRADLNNPDIQARPLYIRPPDVTVKQPIEQCA